MQRCPRVWAFRSAQDEFADLWRIVIDRRPGAGSGKRSNDPDSSDTLYSCSPSNLPTVGLGGGEAAQMTNNCRNSSPE